MFHYDRWKHVGDYEDFIAWRCLLGRMSSEEARLAAAKLGQERSEAYKNRLWTAPMETPQLQESRSRGGKMASVALVAWQRKHKDEFSEQCRSNAIARERTEVDNKEFGLRMKSWWASMTSQERANFTAKRAIRQREIKRLRCEQKP
jgi:hypothetical protein